MEPSFLGLFRRSGYLTTRHVNGGDEEKVFEQRERFAVAAVAFCLRHDLAFKQRYVETIRHHLPGLRGAGRADTMTVQVEPYSWSDLLLLNAEAAVVVEHKIGASLQPHQDPDKEAFLDGTGKPAGYGARLKAWHPAKQLGYVVLGKEFKPRTVGGIACAAVRWDEMLPTSGQETTLEADLFDCLGSLGVPSFNLRLIKDEIMNKAFINEAALSARLFEVLRDVCTTAGLKPGKIAYGNDTFYGADEFCFGLPVQKGRSNSPTTKQGRLSALVRSTGKDFGWFGYEKYNEPDWQTKPGEEGGVTTVLLYCGDKRAQKKVLKEVQAFDARLSLNPEDFTVRLVKPAKDPRGDAEWFLEVFATLTR